MKYHFDTYDLYARVFPSYLAIAPVVLTLAAVLPDGLNLQLGGAAAVVFIPLAFLAGQVTADLGKRLEKRLWLKWGGAPTTRFLRHANSEFNQTTKRRIHEKLRSLGLYIPLAEEEKSHPQEADGYYESCVAELIRQTRDRNRFPHVFRELTAYGFRRNLLGLKPIGLPLSSLAFGFSLWRVWVTLRSGEPSAVATTVPLLSLSLLLVWLFWVNEKAVKLAADRYARFLLEAALNLEG